MAARDTSGAQDEGKASALLLYRLKEALIATKAPEETSPSSEQLQKERCVILQSRQLEVDQVRNRFICIIFVYLDSLARDRGQRLIPSLPECAPMHIIDCVCEGEAVDFYKLARTCPGWYIPGVCCICVCYVVCVEMILQN